VIEALEPSRSRSKPIRRASVSGALRDWLRGRELVGPTPCARNLALSVAAELDRREVRHYAPAKLSSERRSLLAEIEGPPALVDARDDVRRLLGEVFAR
jgi:hypothetical protein